MKKNLQEIATNFFCKIFCTKHFLQQIL